MQAIDRAISLANFPEGVIATNVGHMAQARVVVLLGSHQVSPKYASDCDYIQDVVAQLVRLNTVRVLAEDHWKKTQDSLCVSHLPNFAKMGLRADGWDDPNVCQRLDALEKNWQQQFQALLPQNAEEKELYLLDCEERHIDNFEQFTLDTFDERQESLIQRLFVTLQEGKGKEVIALLCGPEHLLSTHPRLQPACRKLLEVLHQVPFIVLKK